jgi:hypothetical protein
VFEVVMVPLIIADLVMMIPLMIVFKIVLEFGVAVQNMRLFILILMVMDLVLVLDMNYVMVLI